MSSIKHYLPCVSTCRVGLGLLVATAAAVLTPGAAHADLVYWQNFDSNTSGIPDVTLGGGTLATQNSGVSFSNSGGVFGGSLDATGNVSNASTGRAVGNGLVLPDQTGGGQGSMNQITLTYWMKTQDYTAISTRYGRTVILGASGITDYSSPNAFGFAQGGANDGPGHFDFMSNEVSSTNFTGAGQSIPLDTWYFVAVTYDGTSSHGNNSTVQNAATGGASSVNGQLYQGTEVASVARYDLPITQAHADAAALSQGTLSFGSDARVLLANNINSNATNSRAFDGWLDDIRIYDEVLTMSQIEEVRLQGLLGIVPEPSSAMLFTIGLFVSLGGRRRLFKSSGR